MYKFYNNNPKGKLVGDCSIRAISLALGQPWEKTYKDICSIGLDVCDMPSANAVWGLYLQDHGYKRQIIPNTCPDCYSIREFCFDHPNGLYIPCTGSHVTVSVDGDLLDTWDSGDEMPVYYWKR